jgi:hypothetical protein
MKLSKVQPKSWHAFEPKLHDLPMQLSIDWTSVIPNVVVIHNEKKI